MTAATKLAYDTDEAAAMCGVSPDHIKREIRKGALKAKKSGRNKYGEPVGKFVILHADLVSWLEGLADA